MSFESNFFNSSRPQPEQEPVQERAVENGLTQEVAGLRELADEMEELEAQGIELSPQTEERLHTMVEDALKSFREQITRDATRARE